MACEKGHRRSKRRPYGSRRGLYWCWGCDAEVVPDSFGPHPKPIKKAERQRAKREIKKSVKED